MFTKKCPYCREKIQYKAIVCKHCKSNLQTPKSENNVVPTISSEQTKNNVIPIMPTEKTNKSGWLLLLYVIGVFLALAFFMAYPIVGFLALLIVVWIAPSKKGGKWFQVKLKNAKEHKGRVKLSISVLVLFVIWGIGAINYSIQLNKIREENMQRQALEQEQKMKRQAVEKAKKEEYEKLYAASPQPKITLLSKEGALGQIIDYELKFSVTDADKVSINNQTVQVENGTYTKNIKLAYLETIIMITAENEYKEDTKKISLIRDKTPEEIKEEKRIAEEQALEKMKNHPLEYIEIVKSDWYMGGFGSIPIHTLTLKNNSKVTYANISISAEYYSNSDVLLDMKDYKILDIIPANSTKTFKNINMGFVDNQMKRTYVQVTGAEWMP